MRKILTTLFFCSLPFIAFAQLQAVSGGTGTTTKPTLGQILVGQSNGTYGPQATSTLGISGGGTGASTTLLMDNNGFTGSDTFTTLSVPAQGANAGSYAAFNPSGTFIATATPVLNLTSGTGTSCSMNATSHFGSCSFANQSGNTVLTNQSGSNGVPTGEATTTFANTLYLGISASSSVLVSNGTTASYQTLGVASGGTGSTAFGQGWVFSNGGTGALAASTSPTVAYITATSTTATSTFAYRMVVGTSTAPTTGQIANSDFYVGGNNGTALIGLGNSFGQGQFGFPTAGNGTFVTGTINNNSYGLRTNGTTRMQILGTGNVGIGSSTPATTLETGGDITDDAQLNCSTLSTNQNGKILCTSSLATSTGSYRNATATISSVNTLTPTASSTYQISVSASVKTISAGTLTITCTYTSTDGIASTVTFFPMGLTSAGLTGTGVAAFSPAVITPMKNTAVTIVATFTGVSINYDVDGSILPIGSTTN